MDQLFESIQKGIYDKLPKRYSTQLNELVAKCLKKKDKRSSID